MAFQEEKKYTQIWIYVSSAEEVNHKVEEFGGNNEGGMKMPVVSMSYLLEAGVHFGHQTKRWNPKMKEYIFTSRDDIYIIDLQKTVKKIEEAYEALKKKIVPPYDRNNFLNKWQKLCLDKPSHTLVAHLSVDTYSHIHPVEPRGISVREAARLQSFPDGYIFQCNMGEAYKQIGNAVPPLLAKAVAAELYKTFSDGND